MHDAIRRAVLEECLRRDADHSQPAPDFSNAQFAAALADTWKLYKALVKAHAESLQQPGAGEHG